jgi:hypothetical protein
MRLTSRLRFYDSASSDGSGRRMVTEFEGCLNHQPHGVPTTGDMHRYGVLVSCLRSQV